MALTTTAQESTAIESTCPNVMQQVTIEARFRGVVGENLDFHLPVWRQPLDHRPCRCYVRH